VLIIVPACLAWWPLIQQVIGGRPVGQNPAPDWAVWILWAVIGIGLPLAFAQVSMIVEVYPDAVRVRYRPFVRRTIAVDQIASAKAITYNPVKEYGGWGVKGWSRRKMAYNVSGNRGVLVTLTDGRTVLIGSRHADQLAGTIQGSMRTRRPASARPAPGKAARG
jgi:hypothetical protein